MTKYNMGIEEFVNSYSTRYMFVFHKKESKEEKKTRLSRISSFFFEPIYEVNNLKFKKTV